MSDRTPTEIMKFVRVIKPDAHASADVTGTGIDCLGFEYLTCFVDYGTAGTSLDFKVAESDALATGYADVTSGAITQLTSGTEQAILQIDLRKRKRYIRGILGSTGTNDAAVAGVLSNYKYNPVTQSADETVTV